MRKSQDFLGENSQIFYNRIPEFSGIAEGISGKNSRIFSGFSQEIPGIPEFFCERIPGFSQEFLRELWNFFCDEIPRFSQEFLRKSLKFQGWKIPEFGIKTFPDFFF